MTINQMQGLVQPLSEIFFKEHLLEVMFLKWGWIIELQLIQEAQINGTKGRDVAYTFNASVQKYQYNLRPTHFGLQRAVFSSICFQICPCLFFY